MIISSKKKREKEKKRTKDASRVSCTPSWYDLFAAPQHVGGDVAIAVVSGVVVVLS
jgi:hypothetical protein